MNAQKLSGPRGTKTRPSFNVIKTRIVSFCLSPPYEWIDEHIFYISKREREPVQKYSSQFTQPTTFLLPTHPFQFSETVSNQLPPSSVSATERSANSLLGFCRTQWHPWFAARMRIKVKRSWTDIRKITCTWECVVIKRGLSSLLLKNTLSCNEWGTVQLKEKLVA